MTTPTDKPCTRLTVDGYPCPGTMTYTPRHPIKDAPPKWVCESCGKVEEIDDDPGTISMFGDGGAD